MPADCELVGIGNAIMDIFALSTNVSTPGLGNLPQGQGRHIAPEELAALVQQLSDPVLCAGGGAANTVKLAAQLGIKTAFIGSVGNDAWGERFRQELEDAGTAAHLVTVRDPTGGCVVLKEQGSNARVFASPAAALALGPEHVDRDIIRRAQLIMLDGYILGRTRLVEHVMQTAEQYGTFIAIDAGSVEIVEARASRLETYCRTKPLILFLNEDEAEAFCKHLDPRRALLNDADKDEEDRYLPLQNLTKQDIFPIIAVKLGDQGGRVFANGEAYLARTQAIVPFDTTGAGDAFAAGFLAAWLRGKSLSDCAEMGNRLAREIIRIPGTKIDARKLASLRRSLS